MALLSIYCFKPLLAFDVILRHERCHPPRQKTCLKTTQVISYMICISTPIFCVEYLCWHHIRESLDTNVSSNIIVSLYFYVGWQELKQLP